jgi:hypothetical protein
MRTCLPAFLSLLLLPELISAQSTPLPLRQDISIQRILTVRNGAIRLAKDPVSGALFYNDASGNVYKIIRPSTGPAYDSLVYTTADHGIDFPECIAFRDSVLYILGNNTPNDSLTTGILRKGTLQPNGTRVWRTVMLTQPFPTSGYFDHRFSSFVLSPAGDSITINSGSRGDHGEIESCNNQYPNLRNVPLTAKLFRISASDSTYLQNNNTWLASQGYVFATGTRNTFSMAYDANGNLFGLENSGDRDHSDEMNWLRRGRHYGFPYRMGDYPNPQQYPSYDPNADIMINHYSQAWRSNTFYNDPTFPACTCTFEGPIRNTGPDCDKFRDTVTGGVKDASDLGISIGTFTAHRSPLGLIFDTDSIFSSNLTGDAFMLCWTKGLDSTGGIATPYDTSIGPFVDPSQDMVHLKLTYHSNTQSYTLSATRIIADFENPVDEVIDSGKVYIIENGYTGTSGLFEVTMPLNIAGINEEQLRSPAFTLMPNPTHGRFTLRIANMNELRMAHIQILNPLGEIVLEQNINPGNTSIDLSNQPRGIYFVQVQNEKGCATQKIIIE